MPLEPTYEGLKRLKLAVGEALVLALEPTYEGLKQPSMVRRRYTWLPPLEPTYEGLKRTQRSAAIPERSSFGAYL